MRTMNNFNKGDLTRSHLLQRASALDLRDVATPSFGHSYAVFDLFIETHFLHLLLFMKNTRQKAATIASNSDSLAKSEVCNQSLVFSFIDEKP